MDKRTILAVVLALGVYYLWMVWVGQTAPAEPVDTGGDAVAEVEEPAVPAEQVVVAPEPVAPAAPRSDLPLVDTDYRVCGFDAEVSTDGGGLHSLILPDHLNPFAVMPLWKWGYLHGMALFGAGDSPGPWRPYGEDPGPAQLASAEASLFAVGTGDLDAPLPRMEILEDSASQLVLRGVTADGIEITRTYGRKGRDAHGHSCLVDMSTSWRNTSSQAYSGGLWLASHDVLPEKSSRYSRSSRPVAYFGEEFESLEKIHKLTEPEIREGEVSYLGLADGYFAAVTLLDPGSQGRLWFTPRAHEGEALAFGSHLVVTADLAPGATYSEHMELLVRSKNLDELKEIRPELSELVALGFFGFFARILLWLLNTFYGLVGNWGLAIISMTLLVKGLFFPLTQMSFKSSQRMQSIQPTLKKLREELKDNPEELNRRTMEMFKKEGVNPLGGCLPMLIQMPVWFALYSVLLSSVDLYHTRFLYLQDLSVADPYCVLPTIVVGLMLVQQRFMPTGNMDPAQARMMKMMPLIFGFFFFTFPSGLVLYIFVNMILTIAQQWFIKRKFGTPAAPEPAPA